MKCFNRILVFDFGTSKTRVCENGKSFLTSRLKYLISLMDIYILGIRHAGFIQCITM